jgi:hypothetical protein
MCLSKVHWPIQNRKVDPAAHQLKSFQLPHVKPFHFHIHKTKNDKRQNHRLHISWQALRVFF